MARRPLLVLILLVGSSRLMAAECDGVELVLTTAQSEYELGDPIYFEVAFTNVGTEPVFVPRLPLDAAQTLTVTALMGGEASTPDRCGVVGTSGADPIATLLLPGESATTLGAVADVFLISEPGDYLLSAGVALLGDPAAYLDGDGLPIPTGLMCAELGGTSSVQLGVVPATGEQSQAWTAYLAAREVEDCPTQAIAMSLSTSFPTTRLGEYLALRATNGTGAATGSPSWLNAHPNSPFVRPVLLQTLRWSIVKENRERAELFAAALSNTSGWPLMTQDWLLREMVKVPPYVEEPE